MILANLAICLPESFIVELEVLSSQRARLTLHEGRYHQARWMFAAIGNHVGALHWVSVGGGRDAG